MENEKTFTQEELDSIIEGRLARERQKYADYEDLRAKASKYDEYQEQSKTELQKEKEKSDALQAKLTAEIRNYICICAECGINHQWRTIQPGSILQAK